ncbi:ABC transporter ATP-binding protein [Paenibacillus sp. GXUN7292]|uniref:ABC transporter ATP-binding protein n=1 Tax=Paenibacillus sp. GXUN7292 TaxID=3422499 RepID=UPI003D7DA950
MSFVEARQISKRFGTVHALKNINMTVEEGEILGFIGPNGAGKSTMIRIMLGLLKPSDGQMKIFNKDAWAEAVEIHKKIAYVPGDVYLWPNLTGGEVIDLLMNLSSQKNDKQRDFYIKRFELDPRKKCQTYSKGNRQKVALVAALASDADLYIFDEPTSGLDPLMERIFQESVLELKAAGKTVLLSSHILSEVEKLCDRVAIIREGEIIETGTLQELRHLTRHFYKVETNEEAAEMDQLPGIYELKQEGCRISFQAEASALNPILQHLSKYTITYLESTPPTLEELFMGHYQKEGAGDA